MNEEGDQSIRWMACVYAKEIVELASALLLEEAHPNTESGRAGWYVTKIETALKNLKFNLKEKSGKPLGKQKEATPDR